MDILTFKNIYEQAKTLKSDIILCKMGNIYGINLDRSILKVIYNCPEINKFETICYFHNRDMSNFIKYVGDRTDVVINQDVMFCDDQFVYINNGFYIEEISRISNMFEMEVNYCSPVVHQEYINDTNLKSAQKNTYIVDKDHLLIRYGNMLPINKSDNVILDIYQYVYDVAVYHFTIYKKKKEDIHVFMKCLNIQ